MEKTIIGIVAKPFVAREFYNWTYQRISDPLRFVINKNNGIVLGILPQTTRTVFNEEDNCDGMKFSSSELEDLVSIIEKCDGIILQGGSNSQNYEEFVAKYCYDNDIPLLGICAGSNVIIRAIGGKTEKMRDMTKHYRPDLKFAHKCVVDDKDSLFYNIVKTEIFDVNSIHDYTGVKIPNTLSVVAHSDDGLVEVVEAKDKKFFIGIKYHPELLTDVDEKQNRIFEKFIESCKK